MDRRNPKGAVTTQEFAQARNEHIGAAAHDNSCVLPHRFEDELPLEQWVGVRGKKRQ